MGINFIRGTGLVIIDLRIFNNFYTQNVFITSLRGKTVSFVRPQSQDT
ncbi:hypothetical protein RFEPED_1378 [Rickettsia felis str. Pedreira]|uniref:Uncharacterized protein n=1 Tax=Rickettsia felis str. Pedreira TaxID=1359196 RepID=A0A0F3MT69_RICFI|nr:hypothetical protein [Rickettsia felis]KJV58983.1 hypothetical protein RFEPED_1378 [Rickettsia felis str. Pedreira]